ncbi:MAG: hypothetical protein ACLFNU_00710 [Bacteroidales bacterium]
MQKVGLIVYLLLSTTPLVFAQSKMVRNPVIAYKSHSELHIDSIGFYADSTVAWFKATNRLPKDGWFCADSSTILAIPSQNERLQIKSARSIPWCPDAYSFKSKDDELLFALIFPHVPNNPKVISIVEDCERACFVLEGIILNDKLNEDHRNYDKGVKLFVDNKLSEAYKLFTNIIDGIPEEPTHIYGYSYLNLIRISWQRDDSLTAEGWIKKLKESALPKKEYYLKAIEKERKQRRYTY